MSEENKKTKIFNHVKITHSSSNLLQIIILVIPDFQHSPTKW